MITKLQDNGVQIIPAITGQFAPRAPEHLERLFRSCWVLAFRAAAGEWESPVLRLIVVHHFRWWASWRAVVEGAEDSVLSLDYFVAFVGSCFAQVVDLRCESQGMGGGGGGGAQTGSLLLTTPI